MTRHRVVFCFFFLWEIAGAQRRKSVFLRLIVILPLVLCACGLFPPYSTLHFEFYFPEVFIRNFGMGLFQNPPFRICGLLNETFWSRCALSKTALTEYARFLRSDLIWQLLFIAVMELHYQKLLNLSLMFWSIYQPQQEIWTRNATEKHFVPFATWTTAIHVLKF